MAELSLNYKVARDWGKKDAWNRGSAYVGCSPGYKRCPTCGEQSLSEFWKEKRNYDGLASVCKHCWKERYANSAASKEAKQAWYERSKIPKVAYKVKYRADEAYIDYLKRSRV